MRAMVAALAGLATLFLSRAHRRTDGEFPTDVPSTCRAQRSSSATTARRGLDYDSRRHRDPRAMVRRHSRLTGSPHSRQS